MKSWRTRHTPRKQAGLEHAQEPARCHQSSPILHQTLADHDQPEAKHTQRHYKHVSVAQKYCGAIRTPCVRLQLLHQHVGRNFEDDVGDKEDGKGGVIFGSGLNIQVGFETQNGRVTDIDAAQLMSFTPFGVERPVHWESCIPIQKCKQIHDAKTRHHMPVNLGHQLALVDGGVLR